MLMQCIFLIGLFLVLWNGIVGLFEDNYAKVLGSLLVGTCLAFVIGGWVV